MSPIKHTDSALCNCPICLAVRAMRTRLLCRSHVLFPWHGRPARGKPGSNLGPGRPGSLVNASAVGGSLTRFPWWIQSSQIGQVMHHGRDARATRCRSAQESKRVQTEPGSLEDLANRLRRRG